MYSQERGTVQQMRHDREKLLTHHYLPNWIVIGQTPPKSSSLCPYTNSFSDNFCCSKLNCLNWLKGVKCGHRCKQFKLERGTDCETVRNALKLQLTNQLASIVYIVVGRLIASLPRVTLCKDFPQVYNMNWLVSCCAIDDIVSHTIFQGLFKTSSPLHNNIVRHFPAWHRN